MPGKLGSRNVNHSFLAVETRVSNQTFQVLPPSFSYIFSANWQRKICVVSDQGGYSGCGGPSVTSRPVKNGVATRGRDHVIDMRYHLQSVPIVSILSTKDEQGGILWGVDHR